MPNFSVVVVGGINYEFYRSPIVDSLEYSERKSLINNSSVCRLSLRTWHKAITFWAMKLQGVGE